MTRKVTITADPDGVGDIVGPQAAADILGVERTRVARYARQGVMPAPISKQPGNNYRLWLRQDVEKLRDSRAEEAEERKAAA